MGSGLLKLSFRGGESALKPAFSASTSRKWEGGFFWMRNRQADTAEIGLFRAVLVCIVLV